MFSNIPKNNNIRKRTYPKNTKSKNIIKNLMKLLSLTFLLMFLNIPKNNNIRKKTYPKNRKSKNIIKNLMNLLSLIFFK